MLWQPCIEPFDLRSHRDLTATSDTGLSNSDNVTKITTPTFTGTVPVDSFVELLIDGVQHGTQQLSGGASQYSITSSPLVSGTYSVSIRVAENSSTIKSQPSPALSLTIDTVAPATPTTAPDLLAQSDTGFSNIDNITNKNSSSSSNKLWFAVESNSEKFRFFRNGTQVTSGTTSPVGLPLQPDGTFNYMFLAEDLAGNMSGMSPGLSVTIETVAPATSPTTAPDLDAASDSGFNVADNVTNDSTPTFSSLDNSGERFQFYSGSTPVGGGTGTSFTASVQTDGVRSYSYRFEDVAGNLSANASPALSVTIDTIGPSTSPTTAPNMTVSSDSGISNTDNITNDTTPTFYMASTNERFRFFSDTTSIGSDTGAYFTAPGQSEGVKSYRYKFEDAAGNQSANFSPSLSVTIDTTAPVLTVTPVSPDPRSTSVSSIDLVFNEAVNQFDIADLVLSLNGGANLLSAGQNLNTLNASTYQLTGLTSITAASGTYILRFGATVSVDDVAGNTLLPPAQYDALEAWTVGSLPWQNHGNRYDVSAEYPNAIVSGLDWLLLVNELNYPTVSGPSGALPNPVPSGYPSQFFDVSGDDYLTPLDPILVINCINGSCPESLVGGGGGGENRTLESGAEKVVAIQLTVTDLAGQPLRHVAIGEPFQVHVFASDEREVPRGVMAAFLDLQFSGACLWRVGELQFPDGGNFFRRGTQQRGELNEIGAILSLSPTVGGPQRIVSAVFEATRAGAAQFTADPADALPLHHVLVFDVDEPVPIERISFGSVQLLVQPIPLVAADSLDSETEPSALEPSESVEPLRQRMSGVGNSLTAPSPDDSPFDAVFATLEDWQDGEVEEDLLEYLATEIADFPSTLEVVSN